MHSLLYEINLLAPKNMLIKFKAVSCWSALHELATPEIFYWLYKIMIIMCIFSKMQSQRKGALIYAILKKNFKIWICIVAYYVISKFELNYLLRSYGYLIARINRRLQLAQQHRLQTARELELQ